MSFRVSTSVCAFAGLLLATLVGCAQADEKAVAIPAPAFDEMPSSAATATATFAGGCFWGVQGVFQRVQGVSQAVSGYSGGKASTAKYELVGSGLTGHAEAVKITYDPKKVSYGTLLQIYFSVAHDPTQLNRQGPDRGTQYRSAVFTLDATQKQAVERYVAQLDAAKVFPAKIVTQVTPLTAFYPAEDYHQDYATLHPESGYIATFDLPKIANLKTMFAAQYRAEPVLVAGRGVAKR
jgi:peptide-methionine (S)-S-oxide reductase